MFILHQQCLQWKGDMSMSSFHCRHCCGSSQIRKWNTPHPRPFLTRVSNHQLVRQLITNKATVSALANALNPYRSVKIQRWECRPPMKCKFLFYALILFCPICGYCFELSISLTVMTQFWSIWMERINPRHNSWKYHVIDGTDFNEWACFYHQYYLFSQQFQWNLIRMSQWKLYWLVHIRVQDATSISLNPYQEIIMSDLFPIWDSKPSIKHIVKIGAYT